MSDELVRLIERVREAASDELIEGLVEEAAAHGGPAVAPLLDVLEAGGSIAKRIAALTLGQLREARAVEPLRRLLDDGHALVRLAAVVGLGRLRAREARVDVATLIASDDARLRTAAAVALGEMEVEPEDELSEALVSLLSDRESAARRAAASGLIRAGTSEAMRPLIDAFDRESDPWIYDEMARAAGAVASRADPATVRAALRPVSLTVRKRVETALRGEENAELDPLIGLLAELRELEIDPSVLARYGVDLIDLARRGHAGRAYRRDEVVDAVLSRLAAGRGPRSVIIVGPSGCGKTAIVDEVAHRLVAPSPELGDEPIISILQATTGEIMRGTKWMGEWETRLLELVDAIKAPRRAVWHVPDVANLSSAGQGAQRSQSFAEVLLPYLERGEIGLVGEATPEAYRKGIEPIASLRRLFHVVRLEAMDRDETDAVIEAVAADLGRGEPDGASPTRLSDGARERILELSFGFLPGIANPGKAVGLTHQVFARSREERRLASLGLEEAAAAPATVIGPDLVTRALTGQTGLPGFLVDDDQPLDVASTHRFFSEHVLGQEEAVRAIVDRITLIKAGVTDPTRPFGVFFFVGPTGVGKTEIAKALAEFLFGSADRLIRFDMSEFKDGLSFEKLIGNPQAGDRSDLGHGQLTSRVRQEPFSVVLLDEIEKAHPNIFDLFLQVFDDGRLTDARGETVDFRQTIIVMTSNIASDLNRASLGFIPGADGDGGSPRTIHARMEETFRPEFLNRLDQVVVFQPLDLDVMRKIAQRELGRVLMRGGISRRRVIVDVHSSVVQLLVDQGFHPQYGARPLKRKVEQTVLLPLARRLLNIRQAGTLVTIRAEGGGVSVSVREPRTAVAAEESAAPARRRSARGEPARDEVVALAGSLGDRIEKLEGWVEEQGIPGRKESLLKRTWEVTFWDDTKRAREVLTEIDVLQRVLDAPRRLRKRHGDFERFAKRVGDAPGHRTEVTKALDWGQELRTAVEFAEYGAKCRDPRDRADAYLTVSRVGDEAPPDDDAVMIHEMLIAWARRKGFRVTSVLEATDADKRFTSATTLVEGFCATGLLKGEAGLHKVVRGRDRKGDRRTDYVRVEVEPWVPDEVFPIKPADLLANVRSIKKATSLGGRKLRSEVRLTHRPTHRTIEGRSLEATGEAKESALAALRARLAHAAAAAARAEGKPRSSKDDDAVVRTYNLSPNRWVRDELKGGKSGDLDAVLEGDIDRFIRDRLDLPGAEE